MEAAYAFMEAIGRYPVAECGEPVVRLPEAARAKGVELAFSETRLADRYERRFCLREGLVDTFIAAAREMNARGWVLKIEDGYRTRAMQTALGKVQDVFARILQRVVWELGGERPSPEQMFRRLTALVATRPKVGTHMSASALDISVLNRDDGSEVDRGGPYLEISELTPMDSPFVSVAARRNREAIAAIMARHGFVPYPYEFWHYSKGDAYDEYFAGRGRPGRYGAVDVDWNSGKTTPIASPEASLHAPEEIDRQIQNAMKRLADQERATQ